MILKTFKTVNNKLLALSEWMKPCMIRFSSLKGKLKSIENNLSLKIKMPDSKFSTVLSRNYRNNTKFLSYVRKIWAKKVNHNGNLRVLVIYRSQETQKALSWQALWIQSKSKSQNLIQYSKTMMMKRTSTYPHLLHLLGCLAMIILQWTQVNTNLAGRFESIELRGLQTLILFLSDVKIDTKYRHKL